MTVCQHCGRTFWPHTGAGRKARYCSAACKQAAYRKRHTERRTALDLSREEFDAMQDGSLIDQLRFVRDVLGNALRDTATPAGALAAISRTYIDACTQIAAINSADDEDDLLSAADTEEPFTLNDV